MYGLGPAAASPARNISSNWVRWLAFTAFKALASPGRSAARPVRSAGPPQGDALLFQRRDAAFGELELGGQLAALGVHRVALVRGLLQQLLRQPSWRACIEAIASAWARSSAAWRSWAAVSAASSRPSRRP
ncbi:hypothetical protein [Cupriavidus sp. D39]|uniref:hypothetical protein n=1 Tax=Cupriavidus sp. D39 TaxID=2997877 RepID=UPI00226E1866|nr:hypothetical protein [Cupriavidus sp. D39]MCY0853285.1 hypothetical protein [Cupriavidus sp. D39]